MKPKYAFARFRTQALTSAIVVCFGASFAQAIDNTWTGTTDTQWNTPTNWSLGVVPTKSPGTHDAIINTATGNLATITLGIIPPQSILVGKAATGILNHISGDASTGSTNQMHVGQDGGNGTFNLADAAGTGGLYTGLGLGSGSMTVNAAGLYIGGNSGTGSTGKVNVNTSGLLSIGAELEVGTNSSAGTLNIDAGAVSANNWIEIGNGNTGGAACSGTLKMSGGSLTKTGSNHMIVGANGSVGTATINGGSINVNNELWVGNNPNSNGTLTLTTGSVTSGSWFAIGRNSSSAVGKVFVNGGTLNKNGGGNFVIGDSGNGELTQSAGTVAVNGECWIGQNGSGVGKLSMSGGNFNVNNWVAVGRGGNGTFNISGGTFTKTGGGNFLVCGAGTGSMTMTGGLVDIQSGEIQIPEGGTGTMSISGASSEIRGNTVRIGTNGSSSGTLNLNGGTLRANQIIGGSGSTRAVALNGTQLIAKQNNATFINALTSSVIGTTGGTLGTGGLLIDSNNFNVTVPQLLTGSGGRIVKSGLGTLTLTGANTNTGPTSILDGTLVTTTASDATGAVTLGDYTAFGVSQTVINDVYNTSAVTFGTAGDTTLNFDLGAFAGNTTAAPLNVTGAAGSLALNGTVTVNISDTNMVAGSIPLVSYVGSESGAGAFALGTLPDGVVATLGDNLTGLVSLNVTRANDPYWTGTTNAQWNTTDNNWKNEFGGVATNYADGDPAMFDDRVLTGPTAVVLNGTVTPGGSGVTFNNTTYNYSLAGTGKITGATGLLKLGTGSLDISTANDYDGATTITAGTINVATLANSGLASPISKDNLVLNGGTLNYTGPTTTIDRGFTVAATNGAISTTNNLTMSGPVYASGGALTKLGTGNLTLTNDLVSLGASGQVAKVNNGTLSLVEAPAGNQYVSVPGELWVGSTTTAAGNLVVQDSTLAVGSWFTLGRGNGNTGLISSFTANNSAISTGNISTGFNGDLPTNNSVQNIALTNSTWTNGGLTLFAESQNSVTNITLSGASAFTGTGTRMALGANSACNLNISGTSSFTGGVSEIAVANTSNSLVTQTGGTATFGNNERLWFGQGGHATWNQSGGSTTCNGYLVIGRASSAVAEWNVSGGTLTQSPPAPGDYPGVILAEAGTGTLTVSGGGEVVSNGQQVNIATGGGNGTLNLNVGGTLRANRVIETNAGTSAVNFDGGTLVANTTANLDFLTGIDTVTVKSNGAKIDSNGKTIAVNRPMLNGTGGGGLTKSGAGFLQLNSANTYTGTTSVTAGSLGGSGSVAGTLAVSASGTLAPGVAIGTFAAGASIIAGTYACDISGTSADKFVANGTLDVSAATLAFNEITPTSGYGFVIATYTGATPAPFALVTGTPLGYELVYNLGGNKIALVQSGSAYALWAVNNITSINSGADATPGGDPDGDGNTNISEFALNGNPLSGASSGKVVGKVASVGGNPTLVLTLPVRSLATFSGTTEQVSSLVDGVIYKIQGSDELATWNLVVSEVLGGDKTTIETGMPGLDSGWNYRTFQSPGTVTGDPADFLRAVIVNP